MQRWNLMGWGLWLASGMVSGPNFCWQHRQSLWGVSRHFKVAASIRTQSQTVEAAVGTPVFQGSVIQTGKNASLGVTFKDSTVLSLGADTRLTVDEFVYDPNQGQYKFGANLGKGALNYISGAPSPSLGLMLFP